MDIKERVFLIIRHAVETGSVTPTRHKVSKKIGMSETTAGSAICALMDEGRIVRTGGKYTLQYSIPGCSGATAYPLKQNSDDYVVDKFEQFNHVEANRKFVSALNRYFKKREKENG